MILKTIAKGVLVVVAAYVLTASVLLSMTLWLYYDFDKRSS